MPDRPATAGNDSLLMPGERPTLKTLSRVTGYAVATVSRALHDAPDISQETKRRVHEAAREIGYRPNRAGVRLRTGKTNVISLVLATDHDMMNHTARLISSIVAELRETPYHMIITPYFPGEDPMVPVRYLVESGAADGIILNQIEPRDPRIAYLMERGIPFATHGRSDWRDSHAWCDFDNERYAAIAVRALAERGRTDLAVILPPLSQNYARDMKRGAQEAAKAARVRVTPLSGITSDDAIAEIERAFSAHLAEHPETDGVISGSPSAAMAATAAAEATGLTIGADFDIVAKEAVVFMHQFRPAILTVYEDIGRCGRFLANAVIERISNPDAPPMSDLDIPDLTTD